MDPCRFCSDLARFHWDGPGWRSHALLATRVAAPPVDRAGVPPCRWAEPKLQKVF